MSDTDSKKFTGSLNVSKDILDTLVCSHGVEYDYGSQAQPNLESVLVSLDKFPERRTISSQPAMGKQVRDGQAVSLITDCSPKPSWIHTGAVEVGNKLGGGNTPEPK